MTTTRSTAEERRLKAGALRNASHTRSPEGVLLVSASVMALLGLILVYQARSHSFPDLEQQLKSKKLLNLNAVSSRAELIPFLTVFDHPADRQFAAGRILDHLRDNPSTPMSALWQKSKCQPKQLTLLAAWIFFAGGLPSCVRANPPASPSLTLLSHS